MDHRKKQTDCQQKNKLHKSGSAKRKLTKEKEGKNEESRAKSLHMTDYLKSEPSSSAAPENDDDIGSLANLEHGNAVAEMLSVVPETLPAPAISLGPASSESVFLKNDIGLLSKSTPPGGPMDVDDSEESQSGSIKGLTALMLASRDGDVERVRSLIDSGADVNVLNNAGRRAIDYSFDGDHYEVSLLLLMKDSVFPQPASLVKRTSCNQRRERWKAVIKRNSKIRQFFEVRDDFHKKLLEEKQDIVEDMIIRQRGSEVEQSPGRIWVNSNGWSARCQAAYNSKHDTWALLRYYGFKFATQEEEDSMIYDESDINFRRAQTKLNECRTGVVWKMIKKVIFAEVPGVDSSLYIESMRQYFQELNKEESTSCVLRCLQNNQTLRILVDFHNDNLREKFGIQSNDHVLGFTDFKPNKIYAVTMEWEGFDASDIVGNLAHELTHMALQYVFQNGGLPFRKGDDEVEEEYKGIVKDILSAENLTKCDKIIQRVANNTGKEACELIVRVTEMISKYKSNVEEDGYTRLEKQAPSLLSFFNQRVLPEMQEYARLSKLRGVVGMGSFTALYDEQIQVNRSDITMPDDARFVHHGHIRVLNVSNLKLGISHLKKSSGDLTWVDWTRYKTDRPDVSTAVRREVNVMLSIVWDDVNDIPKFCNIPKNCTNRNCVVKNFREVENSCVLVVPNNPTIDTSFEYAWGDLSDDTRQWLLEKKLNFGGLSVKLSEVLQSVEGNESLWGDMIDPMVLSKLIDEEKLVLGRGIEKVVKEGAIIRALQVGQMELNAEVLRRRPYDVFFIKDADLMDLEGKEEVSRIKCAVWNEDDDVPRNVRCFALGKVVTNKSDSTLLERLSKTLRDGQHMGRHMHFAHLFQLMTDGKFVHICSINCRFPFVSIRNLTMKSWCSGHVNAFHDGPNEPLIIADSSGSGKSFWVKMTASSMKERNRAYWVDVVKLSDVAHMCSKWGETKSDQVIDHLLEMMDGGGGSCIEKWLFKLYCQVEKRCFIFFDGFDEVSPKYKASLILFLKQLVDGTKVRFFITTRCEESPALERNLCTLSYHFVPLNNGQQAAIMDSEWKACLLKLSREARSEKIKAIITGLQSGNTFHNGEGISKLVEKLKSPKGSDIKNLDFRHVADEIMRTRKVREEEGDGEFLGIPLHVWMLTTVAYEENFNMQHSMNTYQLYKQFIELKIDLYCTEKISLPDSKFGDDTRAAFRNYDWLKKFAKFHVLGGKPYEILGDELDKALSMGLVSIERGSTVFVHETFGEFLFFLWLKDREEDETINNIWFDMVLYSTKFQRFRQFLNVMLMCEYKGSIGGKTEISQKRESLLENKPIKKRFVRQLQKSIYTCILEGQMGVFWYLIYRSKQLLPSVIFDKVDWDIKELEAVKALEELERKPFYPKNEMKCCQNAIKFCGKLVSRTLSVKKSGIRCTKVDYLRLLTELLRVAKGHGLAEMVNELVEVEGLTWMGINNYHLWRDISGKDEMGKLFVVLRETVSPHVLVKKLMSPSGEKIVENAIRCSWDTLVNFVESICKSKEDKKLFLEGDNFYCAWVSVVEKCGLGEVNRFWEYLEGKHHQVGLSKKAFFCRRRAKKKTALSSSFFNRRNPEVSSRIWEVIRKEIGDDECKTFLVESNFRGMHSKRRLEHLCTYGFLRLLEELLQNKFLDCSEARRLLFPLGMTCNAVFEKCCMSRSLLSLHVLQSILEDMCVQSKDVLLSLTNHYASMTSLCFGNHRRSGPEHDILSKKIGEEFRGICPTLESKSFVEKDRRGRLCHLSSKAKGADMKSFLVLFNRQVQLEINVLKSDLFMNRFRSQWAKVYDKLPSHECKEGGGHVMKTKAYSMAYVFAILGECLTRERLSECLTDEKINYDPKAVLKLNEIIRWTQTVDV